MNLNISKKTAALTIMLLAAVAFAAPAATKILRLYVLSGLTVGTSTASHAVTSTLVADMDYDFASSTIVCTDTPAQTLTGAKKGDPCFVGIGPRDGGTAIVTDNSVFSCIVTADDAVKLRHCAVGTAIDPVDAGYQARVIGGRGN